MADQSDTEDKFWLHLPKEVWFAGSDIYQFKGFWFGLPLLQGTKKVLTHFNPLPTDVILASFPKTGTTWLKSLLFCIVNRPSLSSKYDSVSSLLSNHPHELVPTLEIQVYKPEAISWGINTSDASVAEALSLLGSSTQTRQSLAEPLDHSDHHMGAGSTRIFSTHIPYQLLADHSINSSECKIVYVTRNPKDTVVSYWHFMRRYNCGKGEKLWPLETAVDKFCQGISSYGPYYDHVLGYKKECSERPNKFCFLTYEDLQNHTKAQVKRLAEFLGCPFGKEEEHQVDEIVKSCSIDSLKTNGINQSNECPNWIPLPYSSFFRQGQVGDHKNHLTPEMIKRIDAITKEKFYGSGFGFGI